MNAVKKIAIIGANGYVGRELMRLVTARDDVTLTIAVSRTNSGTLISDMYPELTACQGMRYAALDMDLIATCDLAFVALPHAASAQMCADLLALGLLVIDMSADYRYDDLALYESTYRVKHPHPELLIEAAYGLVELMRDSVRSARLVGNPGCYTTSAILPLFPLLAEHLVDTRGIIINSASGVSGAGRRNQVEYSYCELDGDFGAYAVGTHRHTSEIEEKLAIAAGEPVTVTFVPHLLPVSRGILSTIYARPLDVNGAQRIAKVFDDYYGGEQFVQVLAEGNFPSLRHVVGNNRCVIGWRLDSRTGGLVIVSALDNLLKGAAGQAVQNMELLLATSN